MDKKPWQSRTLWISLVSAAAAFFPPVQALIAQNPEIYASALGAVFALLRLITKDKIAIS